MYCIIDIKIWKTYLIYGTIEVEGVEDMADIWHFKGMEDMTDIWQYRGREYA